MTRRVRMALVVGLLVAVPRVSAQVDEPTETDTSARPGDVDTERAQRALEAFVLGTEAAASGRVVDAVGHFETSLELVPKVSTAFNLAITRRGLGRTLAAEAVLRDALAGEFGPPDALAPLMRQRLEEIRAEVCRVRVEVALEATGDEDPRPWVELDGTRVDVAFDVEGDRRTAALRLDAGGHHVRIGAEGYVADELRLELVAGASTTLIYELRRPRDPGTLRVDAHDDEARIRVWRAGGGLRDPLADALGAVEVSLQPGDYRLLVQGVDEEERTIVISSGQHSHIEVDVSGRRLRSRGIILLTAAALLVGGAVVAGVIVGTRDAEPIEPPVWGNTQVLTWGR